MPRKNSVPQWPPAPPHDETEDQRKERLKKEAEAKRKSDQIDRVLGAERERQKKVSRAKILLLGQAESGKSTVLKNFELHFAPKAFEAEAEVWRPVIHLNLVRSVNFILNFLAGRFSGLRDSALVTQEHQPAYGTMTAELRKLCIRLAPLRQVEESLSKALSGSSDNGQGYNPAKAPEVSIPSGSGWKKALAGGRSEESNVSRVGGSDDGRNRRILAACGEDIARLWNDPAVQQSLRSADIALEEQPGFFLDQAERITEEEYKPKPEDVLKARVITTGPEEHVIRAEAANENAREWTIYDVGGHRSQRAAWAQFFDDVNIIIFLAPMSGFNQVLAEDESINRLTDSLRLWQEICSNKVLASVEFVIFLNKFDILESKLKSGIQFSQFVTSYVGKPNEPKPVARYMLDVFVGIHHQHSSKKRKVHPHVTCAVDTRATSTVISRIREIILVKLLATTNIL
ncbi:hypothetical protein K443DRAFT_633416 [Laccaria amethystina LaAM-08-1]|uniref:G-alpha-domain-containing protein n=1 Tax=Laccaria amethystina LaAM-08-1 TaxID=1095629 RepID=A0A0C9XH47_9AGAR|nr:hypothetical protein K443DRAFT_633416 [Laccaria amethystina LaAM-08-1]